jgi:hypothetical protein
VAASTRRSRRLPIIEDKTAALYQASARLGGHYAGAKARGAPRSTSTAACSASPSRSSTIASTSPATSGASASRSAPTFRAQDDAAADPLLCARRPEKAAGRARCSGRDVADLRAVAASVDFHARTSERAPPTAEQFVRDGLAQLDALALASAHDAAGDGEFVLERDK